MRRLFAVLAVVPVLMALSVMPANAAVITKFDLRAARVLQKGKAVDLTFNLACEAAPQFQGGHNGDFGLVARVDQRVGKTTVTSVVESGEGIGATDGSCRFGGTTFPVTLRVQAPDGKKLKFRPKSARVTAYLSVCDFAASGCTDATSTTVIRLSKKSG